MKLKHLFIASMAALGAFASCSNEGNANTDGYGNGPGDTKDVFMQISQAEDLTRTVGKPSGDITVEFKTGTIVFTKGSGGNEVICNVIKIVDKIPAPDPEKDGEVTVAQLNAGALIGKINAGAATCHIYANTGSVNVAALAVPNTSFSTVAGEMWGIGDINLALANLNKVPLYGIGKVAPGNIDGKDVLMFEVPVAPVSARIQLAKLSGDNTINSYELDGVFINNYFVNLKANLTLNADNIKYNGIDSDNYGAGKGTYTDAENKTMIDEGTFNKVDNVTWTPSSTSGDVWGYNIFPNYGLTRDQLPHIVLRLKNVVIYESNGTTPKPLPVPQFLTIKGYHDGTKSLVNLEGGKSYTLTDLEFNEDNLSERPESGKDIDGHVKVTVTNWTNQDVTGQWD